MTDTLLYSTPWLELRKLVDPEHGIDGYVYSREARCEGNIIAVLPFRIEGGKPEVLLRREVTPCWSDRPMISAITGGVEKDQTPLDCVVQELDEEAGYRVHSSEVAPLGVIFGTKSTDTVYHLFTVDLSLKTNHVPSGDGSYLESLGSCFWSSRVSSAMDPMVYACFIRMFACGILGQGLGRFY